MKNSGIPRIWFFVILFVAIVAAHFVVLRVVVKDQSAPTPPPEPPRPPEQRETAPAPTPGGQPPANPAAPLLPQLANAWASAHQPPPPPKPPTRFRKPSANPRFGAPLDFSQAARGDLPQRLVPGLKKWSGTGIIVDMDTRKVLWEKDPHRPVAVASMVKMMTLLLVAEELERNPQLALDTPVTITKTVMQVPRTGVLYLAPGEVFSLRELLIGIVVKSANDAATQIGEVVDGSVSAFVRRMNARAAELNLKSTVFYNPCGLPDAKGRNAKSSAADMVLLGERLLEYPFILEMCLLKQYAIRDGKTIFVNTNKLIAPHYPGVDGLKTGYTRFSGSCLTFSVLRNGRRIVGCVTGFGSARDRDVFCRRLIDWAYDPQAVLNPPREPAGRRHPRRAVPAKQKSSGRAAAKQRK